MTQKGRPRRVAELIREEIATMLSQGVLKDARLGFVSVMGVTMSRDLRYANVYVSLYGEEKDRKSSLIALRNSAGFVRSHLRKALRTKVTPEVRFFEDDSLDKVYELEKVFEKIHEQQKNAPMIHVSLETIVEELRGHDSFLLTSHANPDGDAVGSMLGLRLLLLALGKRDVHCALADPVPRIYRSLPGADKILAPDAERPEFSVAVLMDVAKLDRTGDIEKWIPEGTKVILLDHHLSEDHDATLGFSDPSFAATGEIIHELWRAAELPLTKDAARCIYVAQITDTGVYRFSNTSPRSHRIAAELLDTGIDHTSIAAEVFDNMSLEKFNLLKLCLSRMTLAANGRVAYSWLAAGDLASCGARKEHLDGLVNYARNLDGVEVGALFYELEPGKTKVSLRSQRGFNSAAFLEEFGGGGHAPAAGATVEAPLEETRTRVLASLEEVLSQDA